MLDCYNRQPGLRIVKPPSIRTASPTSATKIACRRHSQHRQGYLLLRSRCFASAWALRALLNAWN
ncbi:hypothetical protein AKJ16_DCAP00238, partial [Drosera capensis]